MNRPRRITESCRMLFERKPNSWSKPAFLLCILVLFILDTATATEPLNLVTYHNPPLEMYEDGAVRGALVEIVAEVVKRTGREVSIKLRPWKRAQYEVKHGISDGCFNTGNISWRRDWAYFHEEALFNEKYVLFLAENATITIPQDMKKVEHIRVGVQRGYAYGNIFQDALDEKRFKEIQEVETIEQNIKKLLKNRIDIFPGDRIPTLYYLHKNNLQEQLTIYSSETDGQEFIASHWPTYVAFSKKTIAQDYVEEFNRALLQVKADGTYQRIFAKYTREN